MAVTGETQSGGDDPKQPDPLQSVATPCTPVSSDNTNFLNTNQILQVTFSWCPVPGGDLLLVPSTRWRPSPGAQYQVGRSKQMQDVQYLLLPGSVPAKSFLSLWHVIDFITLYIQYTALKPAAADIMRLTLRLILLVTFMLSDETGGGDVLNASSILVSYLLPIKMPSVWNSDRNDSRDFC